MSNGITLGRGVVWSVINSALGQALALIVFFVTARFISPADFGVLAICLLVVEFFRQVAIESFAMAITVREEPTDQDYNACFFAILSTSVVGAAMTFGFSTSAAHFLGNSHIGSTLQWVSLLLLTSGASRTHEAWLSRQLKFKALAIRSIVSIGLGGVVGIVLAVNGFGLVSLIAQQLTTAFVATLALWLVCDWKPRLDFEFAHVRRLWKYSQFVVLTSITNFANTQSDTFFSSYYLGATQTGVYTAAKRVLLGLNLILATALNRVALPTFANMRKTPAQLPEAFLSAVAITSTVTAPAFAALIILGPDLATVFMGERWAAAGSVISILSVTIYLTTIGQYNQSIMLIFDKPHWQTVLTAIYAVSNIALFYTVVRYGLTALAIGFTARAIVLYPLSAAASLHLLRIQSRIYAHRLFPSFASSMVMVLGLIAMNEFLSDTSPMNRLFLSVPFGFSLYVLSLYAVGRRDLIGILLLIRGVFTGRAYSMT